MVLLVIYFLSFVLSADFCIASMIHNKNQIEIHIKAFAFREALSLLNYGRNSEHWL